ncbi:MAG: hypothetical protein RLY61_426 [Candidatus Parcubacteria bacterium]
MLSLNHNTSDKKSQKQYEVSKVYSGYIEIRTSVSKPIVVEVQTSGAPVGPRNNLSRSSDS